MAQRDGINRRQLTAPGDQLGSRWAAPRASSELGNFDTVAGHDHHLPAGHAIKDHSPVIAQIAHADPLHTVHCVTRETRLW